MTMTMKTLDPEVLDRVEIALKIEIRRCREADLPALEWFGMFTPHRELIAQAFRRQKRGETVLLVADLQGFPVGQVWIDLEKRREESLGLIWAFRVFPILQGQGLGSRLMVAAEDVLVREGFLGAEVGAEKGNPGARKLYERLGYRVAYEAKEDYEYTPPGGTRVVATMDQWILRKVWGPKPGPARRPEPRRPAQAARE